ncbi:MAG: hypothetical protein JWO30_2167 [Fibrobacteres bacterium]|nr:hypothetical protein [Fibrobacterota bacterium]
MPVKYLALCALALSGAYAQTLSITPFQPAAPIDVQQFDLPWDGPGAAVFNPSQLTGIRHVDARVALYQTVSGKLGTMFYQGGARIYRGLFSGLAYFSNGMTYDHYDPIAANTVFDRSRFVFEESILTPMLAYGLDSLAGSGYSLSLGAALPRHAFNAFDATRSTAMALDLGARLEWPSLGLVGRFRTGLAARNLFAQGIRLPSDFGAKYKGLRPNYDFSVLWSSIAGRLDLYSEYNLHQQPDRSEGPFDDNVPFVKSLGMEVRPIPMLGLKLERTWLKTWTAGAVLRAPIRKAMIGAEADLSHDGWFTSQDEGRGFMWSLALNAGM